MLPDMQTHIYIYIYIYILNSHGWGGLPLDDLISMSNKEAGILHYGFAVVYRSWASSLKDQAHDRFHVRLFSDPHLLGVQPFHAFC